MTGRIGGKVGVGNENDAVAALVFRDKGEIVNLLLSRSLGQQVPETGPDGVYHLRPVAGGSSDKDHAVRLVGHHFIAPSGIGKYNLTPVRHLYAGHRLTLSSNFSFHYTGLDAHRKKDQCQKSYSFHCLEYFKIG